MIAEGKTEGWLTLPVATLPTWAVFNDVSFDGVKIGPQPGLEDRGSTVIARRILTGGHEAPLITVPRDLILSFERIQEHAKVDKDFRDVLDGLGDFGKTARGAILSFLLMQSFTSCPLVDEKRGVSSPFTEYVKYLPTEMLPTFWTDAERELLVGTTLAPALSAKMKALYREFDQLRAATSHLSWCAAAWWDEVDGVLTFNDWLQVDAMYRSRALEFPGVGDCMVPCIDMANHSSGDLTAAMYEVDSAGNAVLLLQDHKTIKEDDEITITYGDKKGACEMIFSYGFAEDTVDTARELFLDLSMLDDDPLGRAKAATADCAPGFKLFQTSTGIAWEGEYVWLICVNEEDGLSFKIQQTIDGDRELKASWKGRDVTGLQQFGSILGEDRMKEVFRLRAVSILQDRVASQLTTLYGSDDSVAATPHGEGTDVRDRPWHLATRLRTLEADLLERAYSCFEDQKVELSQNDVVIAYLNGSLRDETDSIEDFS